jgi:hypothetical protein
MATASSERISNKCRGEETFATSRTDPTLDRKIEYEPLTSSSEYENGTENARDVHEQGMLCLERIGNEDEKER